LCSFRRYGCMCRLVATIVGTSWPDPISLTRLHQTETYALTFPLITTASGKNGQDGAGAVWLRRRGPALSILQYFVNVDDRDVIRFLKLLTLHSARRDPAICGPARAELRAPKTAPCPRSGPRLSTQEAAEHSTGSIRRQRRRGIATRRLSETFSVPTHQLTPSVLAAGAKIVDGLARAGLPPQRASARRLIEQGGVRLGDAGHVSDDVIRPRRMSA